MTMHNIYGDFDLARATGDPGINLASVHLPDEQYPCSAELIEVFETELGFRATSAIEDEYLGFGPLFDLQYLEYLYSQEDE